LNSGRRAVAVWFAGRSLARATIVGSLAVLDKQILNATVAPKLDLKYTVAVAAGVQAGGIDNGRWATTGDRDRMNRRRDIQITGERSVLLRRTASVKLYRRRLQITIIGVAPTSALAL
jgi:hypothetical protein